MKKFLCIGFLTLFFGLFIMPTNEAKAYDYTIDSYHVDMKVTKQNTKNTFFIKCSFNLFCNNLTFLE